MLRPKSQQTVMVVEDLGWVRRSMSGNLRRVGYNVVEAEDAAGARAAAASGGPPDVILTDEELPTIAELLEGVRGPGPLTGALVVVINPDAEDGMRYGEIRVLASYGGIASLLSGARE